MERKQGGASDPENAPLPRGQRSNSREKTAGRIAGEEAAGEDGGYDKTAN